MSRVFPSPDAHPNSNIPAAVGRTCRLLLWGLLSLMTLLAVAPLQAQGPAPPTWRFTLEPGESVGSTITLVNRCRGEHRFRIRTEQADYVHVALPERGIMLPPRDRRGVEIRFDASRLAPGEYSGALVVQCVDCQQEPGCSQDRETFRFEMSVPAPIPTELLQLPGAFVRDEVLVFKDQAAFDAALEQVEKLSRLGARGQTALDTLEERLSYVSLRRSLVAERQQIAKIGRLTDVNDPDNHFLQDPALRALVNQHAEVGVGASLYRFWDQHLVVEAPEGHHETLRSLRREGDPYRLAQRGLVLHPTSRSSGKTDSCSAGFKVSNLTGGQIAFTNLSTGTAPFSYSWNFGDGSPEVSEKNPGHTFADDSPSTVCLFLLDGSGCSDTVCQVVNDGTCYAHFSAEVKDKVLTIQDHSLGEALNYSWTFGDGGTSTEHEPKHTYSTVGDHDVCLEVTNPFGCQDTFCQFVEAGQEPSECCDANDRVKIKWTYYDDDRRAKSVLWQKNIPVLYHRWGARTVNEVKEGDDWRSGDASRIAILAGGTLYKRGSGGRCSLPAPTSYDETVENTDEAHFNVSVGEKFWTRARSLSSLHEIELDGIKHEVARLSLSSDCQRKNCKKGCRKGKKTCKKTCRTEKKSCKSTCKSAKKTCKEGCSGLKGKKKRQCKKDCRGAKRDCKQDCRDDKKTCKTECKDGKKDCKKTC